MKKQLLILFVLLNATVSFAQIAISENGAASGPPHAAAMLEIRPSLTTNAKGVLMPCISYSDIYNISSPRFGLLVGESTVNSALHYYTGQQWTRLVGFSDQPSNTTFIHYSNSTGGALTISNAGSGIGVKGLSTGTNGTGILDKLLVLLQRESLEIHSMEKVSMVLLPRAMLVILMGRAEVGRHFSPMAPFSLRAMAKA